jgi:hypothetical protein
MNVYYGRDDVVDVEQTITTRTTVQASDTSFTAIVVLIFKTAHGVFASVNYNEWRDINP